MITRSSTCTLDSADHYRIFTDAEEFISSYKESCNFVSSIEYEKVYNGSCQTTKMAEDWAYLLHNSILPLVTLIPCDLPLLEKALAEQNELLKIIDDELVEKSRVISEVRKYY